MGEFPTQKQENFAKKISSILDIDLPRIKTKESYSRFISDNVEDLRREQRHMDEDFSTYGIDESDYIGHIPGDI